MLIAGRLRPVDRYVGFELHPPVLDLLEQALEPFPHAAARGGDGYDQAKAEAAQAAIEAGEETVPLDEMARELGLKLE